MVLLSRLFAEMKAAMVAKNRCERTFMLARRTGLRLFNDAISAAMTKLRSGNNFSRTVGTKVHVVGVRSVRDTKIKLFVFNQKK